MSIIISADGGKAIRIDPSGVTSESFLQEFIAANPDCLPVEDIQEDLVLSVVAREFPTGSGPIDALALDAEGGIYLIETKLFKNPDKRKVIAQVLDYAAAMWSDYSDPADFQEQLDKSARSLKSVGFRDLLIRDLAVAEDGLDELVRAASENCREGALRFLVLMDRLDDRLKRLITYINKFSRFDVFGVELEFYRHESLNIAIPHLFGAEADKEVVTGRRSRWDEGKFFDDARARLDKKTCKALEALYKHCSKSADQVTWGTGKTRGSFNPKFDRIGPKSVISAFSDGTLSLNFGWHQEGWEQGLIQPLMKFKTLLESEMGIKIPDKFLKTGLFLPAEKWVPHVDQLCSALTECFLA